jgi:transcription elongation factor Elf1
MTQLTNEEYAKDSGQCPFCQSRDIVGISSLDAQADEAWQKISCNTCGKAWHDEYKLVGYTEIEP